MNLVLLSSIATGIAVFGLLMAIFDPWLFPPQPKLERDPLGAAGGRNGLVFRERFLGQG